MRFLHTADWQIGKHFGWIEGDGGALLRRARIDVIQRLGRLASERRVDMILVAGDVFDFHEVDSDTLHRTLHALESFSGSWVLLPGNHDHAGPGGVWDRLEAAGLPDHVILAHSGEPIRIEALRTVVLPAPLLRRHEVQDLTAAFADRVTPDGWLRVGLAHGGVEAHLPAGVKIHNPIAADRAETARLDYLALGDWHGSYRVGPRCWYSGTPETDSFRANDSGNVLLVEIDAPGTEPRVEVIRIGRFRWRERRMELFGSDDLAALEDALLPTASPEVETAPQSDDAGEGWSGDAQAQAFERGDQEVLRLDLSGRLPLTSTSALDGLLDRAGARRTVLDVRRDALRIVTTEGDFDDLAAEPVLARAVAALQAQLAHAPDVRESGVAAAVADASAQNVEADIAASDSAAIALRALAQLRAWVEPTPVESTRVDPMGNGSPQIGFSEAEPASARRQGEKP